MRFIAISNYLRVLLRFNIKIHYFCGDKSFTHDPPTHTHIQTTTRLWWRCVLTRVWLGGKASSPVPDSYSTKGQRSTHTTGERIWKDFFLLRASTISQGGFGFFNSHNYWIRTWLNNYTVFYMFSPSVQHVFMARMYCILYVVYEASSWCYIPHLFDLKRKATLQICDTLDLFQFSDL